MGEILLGDCIELLSAMPANSIDSLVTDPPYGWRFMGKAWDGEDIVKVAKASGVVKSNRSGGGDKWIGSDGCVRPHRARPADAAGTYDLTCDGNQAFQDWTLAWAKEALRVLKPGGHAVIFCGPRTYHRMACGVENAGFEVRDQLQWLFGSGFPKSLDISKAIDKAVGAERKVVGEMLRFDGRRAGKIKQMNGGSFSDNAEIKGKLVGITAPSTDAAKEWEGWGTALKPANEPILLARKPLSEKTVAANVLKWGVGGLNIDASRIGTETRTYSGAQNKTQETVFSDDNYEWNKAKKFTVTGRFPSNLLLDQNAAKALDAQSRELKGPWGKNSKDHKILTDDGSIYGKGLGGIGYQNELRREEIGGASRFFYVAKASKREKSVDNTHPTVKPIRLMEYLVRLVTPKGGKVLDPFLGSGTTGIAAKRLGFEFIGIEKEKEYIKIARKRIKEFHYDKVDQQCPSSKEKAVIPQADQDTVLQMKFEWS